MEISQSNNDACRLCDENKEKMLSVFEKNDAGLQILNLIKECLPVIIFRTDPLSKQVCKDCCEKLESFYFFKKTSIENASKHIKNLQTSDGSTNKSLQLYLACEDTVENLNNGRNSMKQNNAATSTDDLRFSCCKTSVSNSNSEVELCAELHKAIADSLTINKVMTDPERSGRSRRKRSQAFYHELDDSLCSSLTEYTNTESSQGFEGYHSEVESYESDHEGMDRAKRCKLDPMILLNGKVKLEENSQIFKELFTNEIEHRYYPLSLMKLALNVVNKHIVPGYEPYEFYEKLIEPVCTYCKVGFKNSKLLALHEIEHINIELGEKVDNPVPWHESRDDAGIRNKWLGKYDDDDEDDELEDEEYTEVELEAEAETSIGESLLIPVGTEVPQEHQTAADIVLIMAKPTVNGILLSEYSKEERKAFYKTMKIGGVNKKFCALCRYSFKDNWAIESHYFSLACYYTCRYCGMRFNKQRHRFDEHVNEHELNGDPLSTKIYAASKLNNFVPKIIQPEKVQKMIAQHEQQPIIKVKTFSKKPEIQIKEEKDKWDLPAPRKLPSGGKPTNQAYFCRKCYKVFFKLDEFNVHSKNCDFNNQFPNNRNKLPMKISSSSNSNGEVISPTGRPMRHCAREVNTYKDETRDSPARESPQSQQCFVCFICNTPFPTIYSRNSHMRIHKGEINSNKPPVVVQKPKQNSEPPANYPHFIKQEPLEPEVTIHESEQNFNSSSIGAVSITPISKNPNQKATINPNIMKLVQNNPHLTIKANNSPERQPAASASNANLSDSDKSYKCSSCWEAFANKSHLYFHKKNQCEGSKYPCPFCKKRFGTEAAYSSHIFYSHPE